MDSIFYRQVGAVSQLIKADEERLLLEAYLVGGDLEARDRLFHANMRLAMRIADKFRNQGLDYMDLVQEAFLGLMDAIERFDLGRPNRFTTYAYYVIGQRVKTGLQEKKNLIRMPQYAVNVSYKVRAFLEANPEASTMDVAEEFNVLPKTAQAFVAQLNEIKSMENIDVADAGDYVSALEVSGMEEELWEAVLKLPELESEIVQMRYFENNGKGVSLADAGRRAGVSRQKVREAEENGLAILRENDGLRSYWEGL